MQKHREIIKKMTEILIKKDYLKDNLSKQRDRSRHIIIALLAKEESGNQPLTPTVFSYDYSPRHVAAIVSCLPTISLNSKDDLHNLIQQSASLNSKHIFTILSNQIYILFKEETIHDIQHTLQQLIEVLYSKTKLTFRFGVGLAAESKKDARNSFLQAADALKWTPVSHQAVELYQEMHGGILFAGLPEEKAAHYAAKVLSGIPTDEKEELKRLFLTYGEMNKSIEKSAQKLFLHRNTFQYKSNKIQHYTGYDPKIINEYVVLYAAFILDSLCHTENR